MHILQNRRRFLAAGLSVAGAGAAALLSPRKPLAAEAPPETSSVRLTKTPGICLAPQYVTEDLLREEGFTDVRYVWSPTSAQDHAIARGEVDFSMHFSAPSIISIDAGEPITLLAGVHPGCFELYARESIHSIVELKGKNVGVEAKGASVHVFLSIIAAYVGLDPAKDINWVICDRGQEKELFVDGKIDALLGFPPQPQELSATNIGHVILNSAVDRPWSQYFCCVLAGNPTFVRNCPVATKRVVRAILRATDICASEPTRVAKRLVDGKFTSRYDYALEALKDIPYRKWRDYDPEDTVRFYALRLHELGMIKSSPNKIIANGTDWRFLNEVRREFGI
jgi:NitT/TauT family transport system substrate-binding protein